MPSLSRAVVVMSTWQEAGKVLDSTAIVEKGYKCTRFEKDLMRHKHADMDAAAVQVAHQIETAEREINTRCLQFSKKLAVQFGFSLTSMCECLSAPCSITFLSGAIPAPHWLCEF
jgi:hypothetical protein